MKIYVNASVTQYPDSIEDWAAFISKRVSPLDAPDMYTTKYIRDMNNRSDAYELFKMMNVENFTKGEISAFSKFLESLFGEAVTTGDLSLVDLFKYLWETSQGDAEVAYSSLEAAFNNFETPDGLDWNDIVQAWDSWLAANTI